MHKHVGFVSMCIYVYTGIHAYMHAYGGIAIHLQIFTLETKIHIIHAYIHTYRDVAMSLWIFTLETKTYTHTYRDVAINLRIVTPETKRYCIETHVCELQVHICTYTNIHTYIDELHRDVRDVCKLQSYIYIYIYIYIYTYIHTYTYTYTYRHIHTHIYMHIERYCIETHVCDMQAPIYSHKHAHIHPYI